MLQPTSDELLAVFRLKHGDLTAAGWGPKLRMREAYFTPDDQYEAIVAKLIQPHSSWMDLGCGPDVFPGNHSLARQLAERCGILVGIDPDSTLKENTFVHERVQCQIHEVVTDRTFDVVTMRMVAEHIEDPESAVAAMARMTRPGSKVVCYTVNRHSPSAIAARLIPFWLHHPLKRVLWQTEEKDTFPVAYRMNTRSRLARLFEAAGFREVFFAYPEDCRVFANFRPLHVMELALRRLCRRLKLRYPENCLLGVYEKIVSCKP